MNDIQTQCNRVAKDYDQNRRRDRLSGGHPITAQGRAEP